MSALDVAREHARDRETLAARVAREFVCVWATVDSARISESWADADPLAAIVARGAERPPMPATQPDPSALPPGDE